MGWNPETHARLDPPAEHRTKTHPQTVRLASVTALGGRNGLATWVVTPFKPALLSMRKLQAVKVLEEAAEVVEAFKAYAKHDADATLREMVLEESMDTLQALTNLLASIGATPEELKTAYGKVEARNRERGRYEDSPARPGMQPDWDDELDAEYRALADNDRKAGGR